jgi:hypothetical protein
MASRENRCRRAQSLHCESDERIQEANGAQGEEKATSKTENRQPQERSLEVPMGDPPGDQAGYEPGGDD